MSIHGIIGAGAAGMFAAIQCKKQNPRSTVIVLEKAATPLSKVRISGGGRCNVTNACFDPRTLARNYPRGSKELIGPFHQFQPKDTIAWFEQRHVFLKIESDNRVIPTTNSSETIVRCLIDEAHAVGVEMRTQQQIHSIHKRDSGFLIDLEDHQLTTTHLLLATGSAPAGYEIAKQFNHRIIEPVPSLFAFNSPSSPLLDLSGISVPQVSLTLKDFSLKETGPLLLTHWGFSGPAILKLSAWAARKLHECAYKTRLVINWIPNRNTEEFYQDLIEIKKSQSHRPIPHFLPSNLWMRQLSRWDIDFSAPIEKISNKNLALLSAHLHADPYLIDGKTTHKQEFVTAGGVDLKEIDFKTMQSRIVPNLFFAGEILNIDGITGGFNLQSAWTTGWIAGTSPKT